MKGFEETREDAVNNLNFYRAFENEMIHKYGLGWKKELSIEEETELNARKNKVNWVLLGIERRG